LQGIIRVVEPFTGDSIALPAVFPGRCFFGFDAATKNYKIVHRGYTYCPDNPGMTGMKVSVLTVGADKGWRTVQVDFGPSHDPLCGDDVAVYWTSTQDGELKHVRLDLETEVVTVVDLRPVQEESICCRHPWWPEQPCRIGIRSPIGEPEDGDGSWSHNITAMAYDTYAWNLPSGRYLPRPHALQRGHLLLQESNGDLYAHKIMRRSMQEVDLGCEKLLVQIGSEEEPDESSSGGQFIPVQRHSRSGTGQPAIDSSKAEVPVVGPLISYELYNVSTFAYVPTVSPAPLALYLGTPTH
uniref:Uncharacterized protein n=2 Tax=Aegilops tauschii subsp. strangulata TaxID=200361 RepID=A0A453LER4_AEGTS